MARRSLNGTCPRLNALKASLIHAGSRQSLAAQRSHTELWACYIPVAEGNGGDAVRDVRRPRSAAQQCCRATRTQIGGATLLPSDPDTDRPFFLLSSLLSVMSCTG